MKKYFYLLLIGMTIVPISALAVIEREVIPANGGIMKPGNWQEATIQDVDNLIKSGEIKLMKNKKTVNDEEEDDDEITILNEAIKYYAPLEVIQYLITLGESAEKIEPEDVFNYVSFNKDYQNKLIINYNKKCPDHKIPEEMTFTSRLFSSLLTKDEFWKCIDDENVRENFYKEQEQKKLTLVRMLKSAGMKLDKDFIKTIELMEWSRDIENKNYLIFLIQAGADVNAISDYPKTPLDIIESFEEQDVEIVKVLKEAGAKNFDKEMVLESDKVLWKTDLDYYDINGQPYTGKVYEWELGELLSEKDIENGKVIKTKGCFKNLCMISDEKLKIEQTTYLSGKPLNGMREEKQQELDDGWSKNGYIGNYVAGYPDGLHKTFSNGLTQEITYKMGQVVSKKYYKEKEKTYAEEIYDETGIKTKSVKDGILESEKAFDKDKNPIFIKKYSNGILQDEQIFNPDGSSVIKFSDGRKLTLTNKQKRDSFEPEKIVDKDLDDMGLGFKIKNIVYGNKILCKIAYPRKGFVPEDWEGCYRQFKPAPEWGLPDISLTDKQKEELYYHPSHFFEKNELKLDMSEVNVDITKGTLDTKDITKSLDKLANDIKDSFSEILPVGE